MCSTEDRIVYKYIPSSGIGYICGNEPTLRFTPVAQLNDPFEGKNHINGFFGKLVTKPASEENIQDLENKISEMLKKFNIIPNVPLVTNEIRPFMNINGKLIKPDVITEKIYEEVGILCTTGTPHSICMWANYASDHKGIVIGLDIEHEYFKNIKNPTELITGFNAVKYIKELPLELFSDYADSENKVIMYKILSHLLLYKFEEWEHENEKRLIIHIPSFTTDKNFEVNQKSKNGIMPFDVAAIKKIFLGCRMDNSDKTIVKDFCKKYHIPYYEMIPDEYSYKLKSTRMDMIDKAQDENGSDPNFAENIENGLYAELLENLGILKSKE